MAYRRHLSLLLTLLLLVSCRPPADVRTLGPDPLTLDVDDTHTLYLEVPRSSQLRLERLRGRVQIDIRHDGAEKVTEIRGTDDRLLFEFPEDGLFEVTLHGRSPDTTVEGLHLKLPDGHRPETDAETPAPSVEPRRPNLIVYLVDTLRADRLGCHGNDRGLTPNIDQFAAEGTQYTNLVCSSSWTRPSVASMFTGLTVRSHGVTTPLEGLREEIPTMAEILKERGYTTGGFGANPNLAEEFGLQRGFDLFHLDMADTAGQLHEKAFDWLGKQPSDRPFFLYVHTIEPHHPYLAPPRFRERFAPEVDSDRYFRLPAGHDPEDVHAPLEFDIVNSILIGREPNWEGAAEDMSRLYDAEVACADELFGEFLKELKARGLYEDSLVVFLSDHGEEFNEHGGWLHGRRLYQEQIHSPLLIRYPESELRGTRISSPVSHQDLFPTLLETTGPAPQCEGYSLRNPRADRAVESFLRGNERLAMDSLVDPPWKLVRWLDTTRTRPALELYNLDDDPGEQTDLAGKLKVRTASMNSRLKNRVQASQGKKVKLAPETERQLKTLNYL